jgi:hypothetical protein
MNKPLTTITLLRFSVAANAEGWFCEAVQKLHKQSALNFYYWKN